MPRLLFEGANTITDFEIASLTLQEMAVWATVVTAVATACIGSWQCLLIAKGLRLMDSNNRERAAVVDEQRRADERRHEEAMKALTALIQRTSTAPARGGD